jgi:hypothetical protein
MRHVVLAGMVIGTFGSASPLAYADPAPSKAQCIEANTKGQDLRRDGKLSAAREHLRSCADSACPTLIRDDCTRRLDELERAQPTVVFETKDGAGNDVTAVKVSVDGQPVAESLNGSALSVDPGAHTFTFEVAGQTPAFKRLVLHEGEKGRTERVVIGAAAPGSAAASAPTQPVAGQPAKPLSAESQSSVPTDGSTQRTIGLVVGGVGAAALVAGSVFGVLAISAHSSYEKDCGSNIGVPAGQCNQQGVDGQSDAARKGTFSTAFFIAGGVATAAGAVLFFAAPRRNATSTQVGIGPMGAFVTGRF